MVPPTSQPVPQVRPTQVAAKPVAAGAVAQPGTQQVAQPPKKKGWKVFFIILGIIIVLGVVAFFVF
ncbi:MAG TPA: hypothetical protein ENI22_00235 [Candidatus Pacearchaeota archaeon]|nr:hypothetical protein [Candidatus Pacearchaeota archaeon]